MGESAPSARLRRVSNQEGQYTRWVFCHSEEPWQGGETAQQVPQEVQQKEMPTLQLGRTNTTHQYRLRAKQLESTSAEKDLGVLMNTRLTMSQQCGFSAQKTNSLLGLGKVLPTDQGR